MNIHGAKAAVRKNNMNMTEAAARLISISKRRLRREKLSIREREVKQRLLVVMAAAEELRAEPRSINRQ